MGHNRINLCQTCYRFTLGGCVKPVPGWSAEASVISITDKRTKKRRDVEAWDVKYCPKYISREEAKKRKR